ncbi:MAG TPA: glycoside hydrolase family 3 N-terminal domain-containing protein [Solirubrobacteraceae bacterium]|nr:glycoside hydrolase family 3 N-terminal domain-containing protein [Solirubrobacteraceae bacterium]
MPARGFVDLLALIAGVFGAIGSQHTPAGERAASSGTHRAAHVQARPAAAASLPQTDAKLLGQRIMVGMDGLSAAPGLLARIRAGQVGSVILFSANIGTRTQLQSLTASLQRAARQGRNPPLLIATDQEGGQVKRLPNGPPDRSPPQIAATGSTTVSSNEGRATGRYLKGVGINMDLAPVVDVPTFPGAFIWRQGRAFSFNADSVAKYATAFALGVQSGHAAATAKHFPGVGSAGVDTDNKLDVLRPTAAQLSAALTPYRSLIPRGLDAVMLSTAAFPAYDPTRTPAALSRTIIQGLLRRQLKFGGVTITDALGTPTGHDEVTAGVLAARAGADILLYTDAASGELAALQTALQDGRINRTEAQASYRRIVTLKQRVA